MKDFLARIFKKKSSPAPAIEEPKKEGGLKEDNAKVQSSPGKEAPTVKEKLPPAKPQPETSEKTGTESKPKPAPKPEFKLPEKAPAEEKKEEPVEKAGPKAGVPPVLVPLYTKNDATPEAAKKPEFVPGRLPNPVPMAKSATPAETVKSVPSSKSETPAVETKAEKSSAEVKPVPLAPPKKPVEEAPAALPAKTEARAEEVKPSAETKVESVSKPIPHQHLPFEGELQQAILSLAVDLADVYPQTYEEWEDGFRRDDNPEQEIAGWLHLAAIVTAMNNLHSFALPEKRECFNLLIACFTGSRETVRERAKPKLMSKEQVDQAITFFYEAGY